MHRGGVGIKFSICSKCVISVSKFSRSPYLDSHSYLDHWYPVEVTFFITSDPRVNAGAEARGQNLVHLQNVDLLRQSFLEVHTLTTTYQKVFKLRPYVPCRVCYESMTSDPRVHARG